MKSKLYTMRDRKSGIYGTPFASYNHATAQRDFKSFCSMSQNQYLSGDMELYYIGEFESDTGEIYADVKPEFILGGDVIE